LDIETCQPKFKGYAKKISRLPGVTWYGQKNIWHTVEFYLVTLQDNMLTVFNNNGGCIFRRAPYKFWEIDCKSDKLVMDCQAERDKPYRRFSIKDKMAIEEM
jgi:hypothetical protein